MMKKETMTNKKKKILVFPIFTLTFDAASAAILDVFSQSPSFWKNTKKKKKVQLLMEDKEGKPNPGVGGGGGGSTSTTLSSPPGPPHSQDRISELPKEILVHILGFLEMDEFLIGTSLVSTEWRNLWKSVSTLKFPVVATGGGGGGGGGISLVSTKWRNLWKSVSTLKFTRCLANGGGGGGGIRNNVEKYHNFVDHVLRLRDSQASKIQIFSYDCADSSSSRGEGGGGYDDDDYLERLHNFIVSAVVNQGAQEIHIRSSSYSPGQSSSNTTIIHLNPSIFTPGGILRKFTFVVHNHHHQIQFPRSMCSSSATQLTHLSLNGIRLPEGDDESNAQLHLVCPLLETFHMNFCITEHLKVLDISAPRLNTLSICNVGMRRADFDFLGGCRIEIRTPNLTSLHYEGDVYVDCFTENLPRIANASLKISKERGMVEPTTSFAIKLLKGLTSAESLTLGGFEDFSQDTLKVLLKPFTRLRTLELVTNRNRSSIHGMVHFLNSCSSVEKLLLVWKEDEFVEVEGDEHLMLPQCRLSHLKYVHIQRMRGHENEIEFVKFLLKSSVVLEVLIIKATKNSRMKKIEKNLKQFIEEEPSFRSIKLCVLREEK